jgi:hypothetical protein
MKCEICSKQANSKITLKDPNILDKDTNLPHEWKLCNSCFNNWANQDYDKLSEKL